MSVIIPAYNVAKFLDEAVASVVKTNYPDLEVIIVEDGSTDDTYRCASTLVEKYGGIVKLFTHVNRRNRGAGASRNLGLQYASGDYIAFLDADDMYLPYRFDTAIKVLGKNNCDGVYEAVGVKFHSDEDRVRWGTRKPFFPNRSVENPDDLLRAMLLEKMDTWQTSCITVKRAIFLKTGFFHAKLRLGQDIDMWIKMALVGNILPGEVKKPVALYRRYRGNRSSVSELADRYQYSVSIVKVIPWAKKQSGIVKQCRFDALVTAADHHVFETLKLCRANKNPSKAVTLFIRTMLIRPSVASKKPIVGNLAYALIGH